MALPNLDLALIDLRNQNIIALSDLSSYVSTPGASYRAMQITPPGFDTINVTFTPRNVNIYKCSDLGITCNDEGSTPLPDGIYSVTYTVIPAPGQTFSSTTIDRKFIKIDIIRCKYQHAFGKMDLKCVCGNLSQNAYWQELRVARLYIDGAVAECINGNYKLCFEFYRKADNILNKLCGKYPRMEWQNTWKHCNC